MPSGKTFNSQDYAIADRVPGERQKKNKRGNFCMQSHCVRKTCTKKLYSFSSGEGKWREEKKPYKGRVDDAEENFRKRDRLSRWKV